MAVLTIILVGGLLTAGASIFSYVAMKCINQGKKKIKMAPQLVATEKKKKKRYLYHYTTPEAVKLIRRDGKINMSTIKETGCKYGKGVYLTTAEPHLQNNGNCYFRFDMNDLKGLEEIDKKRGIWLCPKAIVLREVPHFVGQTAGRYLYHYTSPEAVQLIIRDGKINMSTNKGRDARFGEGVYLSTTRPEEAKDKILARNFDDKNFTDFRKRYPHFRNRANRYFRFDMNDLTGVDEMHEERCLWLYPNAIVLSKVPHFIGQTSGE